MTRLACFYKDLDPRTRESLLRYAPAGLDVDWVECPDAAMRRYEEELGKRWTGEDDLLLIEQDKEVFPRMLEHLIGCPQLWCGYTYWMLPEPDTCLALSGFGVTRFSADLQRLVPIEAITGPQRTVNIDCELQAYALEHLGTKMHIHGHTVHHHVYEPAPEGYRRQVEELRRLRLIPPAMAPPAPDPGLLPGSYRLPG